MACASLRLCADTSDTYFVQQPTHHKRKNDHLQSWLLVRLSSLYTKDHPMLRWLPMHAYLHRFPEDRGNLDVYPLPGSFIPVQVLLQPRVKVFGRVAIAEAHHKAVIVRGEGVDGVELYEVAVLRAFKLAEVGVLLSHAHTLLRLEAVPENIVLVLEEGEPFGTFIDLHLRTFRFLGHDKPDDAYQWCTCQVVGGI